MSKEEIMSLDMEALQERSKAIAEETREADMDQLETLNMELDAIEQRKKEIKEAADEKRKAMLEVLDGAGEPIEEVKEERKAMTEKEIRNSNEYLDAWVENLKGRATEEQRTLLTVNATNGTIAVPTYVEDRINTAWESNEILRRIKKTYFNGVLKVGYEVSADLAQIHQEGGDAITEENLVLDFIRLVPVTFKKMVRYSTEILDMKSEAFVDYIVDEIEYQIAKTIGYGLLSMVINVDIPDDDPLVQRMSAASLSTAAIIEAEGMLDGDANPVLITTNSNLAALKAAALSANYGYDPVDGLEVIPVNASALSGALAIVADLDAWQANFPNGDDVTFVFDEYTEAASDIVRVIGRLMAGVGVVAPYKTVVIKTAVS